MLSEHHLKLLTAFVDGELTRRQRKAALRLLHESSEARTVLQDLQGTAHRLRQLPRRKVGGAFASRVLQTIADRGLQPPAEQKSMLRRRWAGYAAAACIVLAMGTAIYLATRQSPSPHAASNLPLKLAFRELAQQPRRDVLAKKLQKELAVRLDVTVRDNATAVERLHDVLGAQGIKMLIDARAQANLKKAGQAKTEYLVYTENIGAEELATMLRHLADDPKTNPAQKSSFHSLIVTALSLQDRQKLSGLLGVDPSELDSSERDETKLFDTKIIEAPKDKAARPTPVPQAERYAMVMAADAGAWAPFSAEVKMFLASRRQQRPGTVQVLLVIRQA